MTIKCLALLNIIIIIVIVSNNFTRTTVLVILSWPSSLAISVLSKSYKLFPTHVMQCDEDFEDCVIRLEFESFNLASNDLSRSRRQALNESDFGNGTDATTLAPYVPPTGSDFNRTICAGEDVVRVSQCNSISTVNAREWVSHWLFHFALLFRFLFLFRRFILSPFLFSHSFLHPTHKRQWTRNRYISISYKEREREIQQRKSM